MPALYRQAAAPINRPLPRVRAMWGDQPQAIAAKPLPRIRFSAPPPDWQGRRGTAGTDQPGSAIALERRTDLHASPIIASAQAYVDTFALHFPEGQPKGLHSVIRDLSGGKTWFEPCRIGSRLIIQQPSIEALNAATPWQEKFGGVASILHISYELTPINMTREQLSAFIRENTLLRWRPRGEMHDIGRTTYFCQEHHGEPPPERNAIYYDSLQSKLTLEPEQPKLEIKHQNARAARKIIELATDIIDIDPRAHFDHHFRLVHFQQYVARNIIAQTRSGIEPGRARGAYGMFQNRAQLFRDKHPAIIARLPAINDRIAIANSLTWGAQQRRGPQKIIK